MDDLKPTPKAKALYLLWSSFPWLLVIGVVLFIVLLVLQIQHKGAQLEAEKKAALQQDNVIANVATLHLQPAPFSDKIDLPAEVEPWEDVWVKAEVPGQVVNVVAREGQRVAEGQLLLELDDRDIRSRLDRVKAGQQLAKTNYERMVALAKQNIIATRQLEEADAQLKDLESQLQDAELALKRTHIRAPISCVLNKIKAKRGDFIGVGEPVAEIINLDQVKVIVGVPESDVAAILDLKEANVVFEALNKRQVVGRKVFLSRNTDSTAHLYDLQLAVSNPKGDIFPGMFARVELIKQVFPQALTVPIYAVLTDKDTRYVYLEKNGRAERRDVRLGALVGLEAQIVSGLQPGDKVLVAGQRQVNAGQAVVVIKDFTSFEELQNSL
jgi:membrane fusion protein (multidrug efflux system)